MPRKERLAILKKIQNTRNTKVLCYLTSDRLNASAQIQKDAIPLVYEHLRKFPREFRPSGCFYFH